MCLQSVTFTNHTVMREALEMWPVKVMSKPLPRHMEVINKIDSIGKDFLKVHHPLSRLGIQGAHIGLASCCFILPRSHLSLMRSRGLPCA